LKLHHVGHITRSTSRSRGAYESLGFEVEGDAVIDEVLGAKLVFMSGHGILLELVEPLTGTSALQRTLSNRSGPYHYAFEFLGQAEDLRDWAATRKLVPLLWDLPAVAFPGAFVTFYGVPDGSLVEIIRHPHQV
jgi:catechol 2,3-dioxygenase-like lactoylglutathione lyase family enzyme